MISDPVVIRLYTKQKLSETQIAKKYSVSTNQIRRILDAHNVPRRSISEAVRYHHITKFNKRPFKLRQTLTQGERALRTAGTMLYWGEGAKRNGAVALTNSDPLMIMLFLRFLRDICGVNETRLRITLHYYTDLDPEILIPFWSRVTGVPRSQFHKPFLHSNTRGTYGTKSAYGTVCVQYSDSALLKVILGWIVEEQERFKLSL